MPDTGSPARSRVISLEGGCNFRDIGGYRTADGATVRYGKVFRAGVLSYFTPGDCSVLSDLRVRAICDLRRADERASEPTRWPDPDAEGLSWDDGANFPTIRGFAARRSYDAAGMHAAMIDLYRALPAWMAPRIGGFCRCVATDRLPLVVHCSAGKDRTGVAVAILLAALGVPEEAIFDDYLLTNDVGNFEAFIRVHAQSHLGLTHRPLLEMPEDIRRVIFQANAAFLHEALAQVRKDHGDVASYLANAAGIDPATQDRMRLVLLDG